MAFFSKRLNDAQRHYSAFDRELLAIYEAVRHFSHFLEARTCRVLTDHKPLTYAMERPGHKLTPRARRHLAYISEFTTDIRHIRGADNTAADALSRSANAITRSATLDYAAIAQAQTEDEELRDLQQGTTSLRLVLQQADALAAPLWCDISTGHARPYIPKAFRRPVFRHFHDMAHPGILATQRLIQKRAVWPGPKFMGAHMHSVPDSEDPSAHKAPAQSDFHTYPEISHCAYRHCGTPTPL
ncbi:uncharacterized protein LOC143040513 [Oratosquilla oratoria]|uniref:uncharacterized protein LOC143040513 n=1 Tax=Oratosquilla oratoria TaxID=337810 RepID=UPI003F765605